MFTVVHGRHHRFDSQNGENSIMKKLKEWWQTTTSWWATTTWAPVWRRRAPAKVFRLSVSRCAVDVVWFPNCRSLSISRSSFLFSRRFYTAARYLSSRLMSTLRCSRSTITFSQRKIVQMSWVLLFTTRLSLCGWFLKQTISNKRM